MIPLEENIAVRIVAKYLKKGNMARCLRDILPSAGLSKKQREEIAEVVHTVVRWKRLYEQMIQSRSLSNSAVTYVKLASEGAQVDASLYPFEYRYSCSPYVADFLKDHEDWVRFLNEPPPTTLCVNFNRSSMDAVISILQKEGLPAQRSILPTAVQSNSSSKYSDVIQRRFAHVQDESSQLVSFYAASLGMSLFDLCAGNGGKSLALASMTKNKKKISAYEMNDGKRTTLRRRCDEYDARVIVEEQPSGKTYDLVLVDAPCSGLGAARRNPEIKYIETVGSHPQTQLSILQQAAEYVKDDGMLFYAVCTVTPEETTQVIQTFVKDNAFAIAGWDGLPYQEHLLKNDFGAYTTLPHGDLFFLSLLKKT
jgi:16S rRNA (cytosine967-C5)-methyltransferase